MNVRMKKLIATSSMIALLSTPAVAQDDSTPNSTTRSSAGDVIVITANRREENLQEAPAVINVLDAGTIEDLRVDSLDDITSLVPGLSLDGNHRDQNRIGMRGAFSSADTPSAGQAVGLYIDGVYYGRSASLGPVLFDIQQVEVLHGPQGTLYGPNVVGGLINIETRDPSLSAFEGTVSATYGNYDYTEFAGRVSFPVIEDELGVSITAVKTDSGGWLENLVTGNNLDQIDTTALRVKSVWTPGERTRVEAFTEYWNDQTYGEARHLLAIDGPPDRFTIPSDFEQTLIAEDASYDREVFTTGVTVAYDLTDAITLTSTTSYHDTDSLLVDGPFLAGPVEKISATRDSTVQTFTQEFLLSGATDRLDWQAGVYYLNDTSATPEFFESVQVPGTPIIEFGYPEFFASTHFMENDTESLSAFAQASFDLTDEITVTAGARYTDESKDSFVETSGDAFEGNYAIEEVSRSPSPTRGASLRRRSGSTI